MGELQDRIKEAGRLLGLPPHVNDQSVFGAKGSLGIQMLARQEGNSEAFVGIVRRDIPSKVVKSFSDILRRDAFVGIVRWDIPNKDPLVKERLKGSTALREAKIKPGQIEVAAGAAVYTSAFTFSLGMPSASQMAQRMQALINEINASVGAISPSCRTCGANNTEPVLLNGIVDRVCAGCIQKAKAEAQDLAAIYKALPIRWIRALAVGTVLAVLGAVVWDAVIIFTDRMYWILAAGIGAVIGWATTKAAGKGSVSIQVMCGLLTFLSIAGGMAILLAAAVLGQSMENDSFNSALFKANFLASLAESTGDLIFAIGGGLIGAAVAAQRAGKPSFEVSVEK